MELQLILKWGGDLTKLGERQAERLGERFTQVTKGGREGGRKKKGWKEEKNLAHSHSALSPSPAGWPRPCWN